MSEAKHTAPLPYTPVTVESSLRGAMMPDKPEDYGEVLYRWTTGKTGPYDTHELAVVRIPPSEYYYPIMICARLGRGWEPNCGERELVDHLLSVIAEKDKALKLIASQCGISDPAEACRTILATVNTALNQPKEQHGKA